MAKVKDLTGQRFGMVVVIEEAGRTKSGSVIWNCRCDCGNTIMETCSNLKSGRVTSCGCKKIERIGKLNRTHGMRNTRLYRIWLNMKNRCNNRNAERYADYGGRGIKVCQDWDQSFIAFYQWAIQSGYQDKLTIDRVDNNGNYEPNNCRWITLSEQNKNKRPRRWKKKPQEGDHDS